MTTKLVAARIATARITHLADGRDASRLDQLLKGGSGGTVFIPADTHLQSAQLVGLCQLVGELHLDDGACRAIRDRGASLLQVDRRRGVQAISRSRFVIRGQ